MSMRMLLQRVAAVTVATGVALLSAEVNAQDGLFRARAQIYGWALVSPTLEFATETVDAASGRLFVPRSDSAARVGRFGLWSDAVALNLDGGRQVPGLADPMLVGEAGMRPRGVAWTVAGTYAAIETPRVDVYTLAGMRHLAADGSFEARSTAWPGASFQRPETWDAILGVRGRVKLGESRWFAPYYFDVGTGQSDFTWQALGGIGYAFSWGGEVVGSWRHLDYNFASGSRMRDMTFSGPSISLGVRW